MKYFIDTEFIEDGKTIDLISIGIVCEDGRELYLISNEYKYKKADDWVKENVILPCYLDAVHGDHRNYINEKNFHKVKGISNKEIAKQIIDFVRNTKPEFYAYYADYDWVVICQLFGRMIDLPEGFPMYCMDLKQMMTERDLHKGNFNLKVILPQEDEHNALADAKWNKKLYKLLTK